MNPSDYESTFNTRGDHYNEASRIAIDARKHERSILVELLLLESHHLVIDAPAGGGYLADGLLDRGHPTENILCVEPSSVFARGIAPSLNGVVASLGRIPVANDSIDRVASLAGLHHLNSKRDFFAEAFRTLKSGGMIAVGDVLDSTPQALFLNGPVDEFTETGHCGIFVRRGEMRETLRAVGFVDVAEKHVEFNWEFTDAATMVAYCRTLFGMTQATPADVANAIAEHLSVSLRANKCSLPWALTYATGVKP